MIDIKTNGYRLTNIYNINKGVLPDSTGLALEKACEADDIDEDTTYYVIAFIRPGKDDNEPYIESVGRNILNIDGFREFSTVQRLLEIAFDILDKTI